MNFADILMPDQIVPRLNAADRWAVIDQLIDVLVRAGKLRAEDRETARNAVKTRETTNSTGIGYGIAMPHAAVSCVSDVVAAFARLGAGVDFQALDNQPVTLCLLLLTPHGQAQKQLQTLASVSRLLTDKDRRQKLNNATSAEEILAIMRVAA